MSPKKTFPRRPIHDQVEQEERIMGLLLRRVRLTYDQFHQHEGNDCWGVPEENPGELVWAQVLVLEAYDGDELVSVAVMANRNINAEKAFDDVAAFPDKFWTRGFADADPVSSTSWRISGRQNPVAKNPGRNIQLPLEPGLTGDMAWQRLIAAAKDGLIHRG